MSYILEALRKSEQERQAGQTPSLSALVADPPRRRSRWTVWGLVLLFALNGVTLGYLWLPGWGKNRPQTDAAASVPVPPASERAAVGNLPMDRAVANGQAVPPPGDTPESRAANPAAALPVASQSGTKTATAARAAQPSEVKTARSPIVPLARSAESARSVSRGAPTPVPAVGRNPAVAPAATRPRSLSPLPRATDETGDVPAAAARDLAPRIAEEAEGRAAGAEVIPSLGALPAEVQQRIPPLKISLFAYSQEPAERFAVINLKRYTVGDSLPGGARLVEIRPDSLVLRLDGAKFQIPRP